MRKICTKCNIEKDLKFFQKNRLTKSGYGPVCKECYRLKSAEYLRKNSDHINARRRERHNSVENKAKIRNRNIQRYGLSLEDYQNLLKFSDNKCFICEVNLDSSTHRLTPHIDHCHETGKVRGVLCSKCNLILGHSNDNIAILNKAISYLEKSQQVV